jgi:hypothetical protein
MTWESPVLCLESAAALLALPLFGEPRDIHLLDPGGKSRRFGDVVVHATEDDLDFVTIGGVTTTSFIDTAVALTRVLPPAFALATADTALRLLARRGVTLDFVALGRERSSSRGRRQLEWVNARATAASESAGEAVSRAVIEWLGFDEPEPQVEFDYEGFHDRCDFYWRRKRTIGESDGYGKYDADDAEAAKAHFISEKVREDRLRRHEDAFARWDWADTMRATPLGDKLQRAGLTAQRPPQQALLATLTNNPRSLPRRPTPMPDRPATAHGRG